MLRKTILLAVIAGVAIAALNFHRKREQPERITIAFSAVTGPTWPLYIAKDAGYFSRYGLDVHLAYAVHPAEIAMVVSGQAAMAVCGLEQAMEASSRDGSLIVYASPFKKSLLALMANSEIRTVRDLKGMRIGVSQLGDAPYTYAIGFLERAGLTSRDVQWARVGAGGGGRAAALLSGGVDATMVSAPAYFRLEAQGYRNLGNISDFEDIYAPSVFLFKKAWVTSHPHAPELLIRAHTEAVKRLYDDKAFAIQAYLHYNQANPVEIEKILDLYQKTDVYERVPYILRPAVQYMLDHPIDSRSADVMRNFDFTTVLDNSIVDKLAQEGFFEGLFRTEAGIEQERKRKIAFR